VLDVYGVCRMGHKDVWGEGGFHLSPRRARASLSFGERKTCGSGYTDSGCLETRGVFLVGEGGSCGRRAMPLDVGSAPLSLFLLPDVFTDDMRVRQVEARCLKEENSAPNGEQPTNPSEHQPWVDVRVVLVYVWWTRM